jgi:hypothetical protein
MPCGILYIIGNFFGMLMSKLGLHCSFRIWNTSHGQKKGQKSKCQLDSRPKKVGNRPDLLGCRRHATYLWKTLDENYNFALDFTSIRGLIAKLWGSKVARVPVGVISGLPLGSPKKESHLDVGSMARHKIYYKGEGGGFPQVRVVLSFVCPCCPWLVLARKVL